MSAHVAAAVKAKVTRVEGHKMGGDCLYVGCVPSKVLIRLAKMARPLTKAQELGVADAAGRVDFAAVMRRVHDVIRDIEPHDSVERYTGLGVEVLQGQARITSPWTVEVTLADGTTRTLTTKAIPIAAGASPFAPPIRGLKEAGFLTTSSGSRRVRRRSCCAGWGASVRGSRRRWSLAVAMLVAGAAGAAGPVSAAPSVLAPLVGPDGGVPAAPWAYAGLPDQKSPATRYAAAELDGRRVLRIEARGSYGNLVHPLSGVAAGPLSWRWRVDAPLAGADLRRKQGDDAALKVCAMFDLDRDLVPFVERQLLRLAESRVGEALPNATLCYVWDPSWPAGSVVPNAYSKRVRFVTLGRTAGTWEAERRDLAADFLRAFGDESRTVPPLRAIAIGADADNTGGASLGWIDDLRLESPERR